MTLEWRNDDAMFAAGRFTEADLATRDAIAAEWGDVIYFCPECDESGHEGERTTACPRHPAEHDATGYMGTGTDYPPGIRRLAGLIAGN